MRTFGFSPRDHALRTDPFDRWFAPAGVTVNDPPYDIEKVDDDRFRIAIAVAGFADEDLDVTQRENLVVVSGKDRAGGGNVVYLRRGIPGRAFERRFVLAENVRATGASLENGLLSIDLVRDVPEEQKPRRIEISGHTKRIGKRKAAA